MAISSHIQQTIKTAFERFRAITDRGPVIDDQWEMISDR